MTNSRARSPGPACSAAPRRRGPAAAPPPARPRPLRSAPAGTAPRPARPGGASARVCLDWPRSRHPSTRRPTTATRRAAPPPPALSGGGGAVDGAGAAHLDAQRLVPLRAQQGRGLGVLEGHAGQVDGVVACTRAQPDGHLKLDHLGPRSRMDLRTSACPRPPGAATTCPVTHTSTAVRAIWRRRRRPVPVPAPDPPSLTVQGAAFAQSGGTRAHVCAPVAQGGGALGQQRAAQRVILPAVQPDGFGVLAHGFGQLRVAWGPGGGRHGGT